MQMCGALVVVCECANGNCKCDAPCTPLVVVNQHSPIQHPPNAQWQSHQYLLFASSNGGNMCVLSKHNRAKHVVSSRFWLVCRYADDIDSLQNRKVNMEIYSSLPSLCCALAYDFSNCVPLFWACVDWQFSAATINSWSRCPSTIFSMVQRLVGRILCILLWQQCRPQCFWTHMCVEFILHLSKCMSLSVYLFTVDVCRHSQ